MRIITASLIVVILAVGAPARAVHMVGIGNRSCGSWIQARRQNPEQAHLLESWVGGYLSGANSIIAPATKRDVLSGGIDAEGLWAWIDNYCRAHPLDSVSEAADQLAADLVRRAGVAAPEQK